MCDEPLLGLVHPLSARNVFVAFHPRDDAAKQRGHPPYARIRPQIQRKCNRRVTLAYDMRINQLKRG
jgi:hypothetical protein